MKVPREDEMDKADKAFSIVVWVMIAYLVWANWPAIIRLVDIWMHMGPPNGP